MSKKHYELYKSIVSIPVPDDYFILYEEFKKYGIEYENPNNFFRPVLTLSEFGTVFPGKFYLYSDVKKSPELEELLAKNDEYMLELGKYINHFGLYSMIQTQRYCSKIGKISTKIQKIEKNQNIKCYSLKERDRYIDEYKNNKLEEIIVAKEKSKQADYGFEDYIKKIEEYSKSKKNTNDEEKDL